MASASTMAPEPAGAPLYRIGEVGRITATKPFVLRYWETEFPQLQPVKSPTGHRLYRRQDIETVFEIKRLLYDEGFTIAGARKFLAERAAGGTGGENSAAAKPEAHSENMAGSGQARLKRKLLLDLRDELRAILTLLERG